ncbi:hypothetical protein [Streptomyces sp. SLBN-118]|uniref:hypothetical protein n=1 Tax=Streptomyces sp. SLBN-118 TaxID=2768454 RepID=UPI0011507E66|nr:hypothetical protein [Streptomyces sp. SLBN-118]
MAQHSMMFTARERGQPTDAETRLRKQVVRLKELREKDKAELEQLRADVQGLVRVVNQLSLENISCVKR